MPDLPVTDPPIDAPDTTTTGVDPATPPSPTPDTLPPGMGPMPQQDPWIGEEQRKSAIQFLRESIQNFRSVTSI